MDSINDLFALTSPGMSTTKVDPRCNAMYGDAWRKNSTNAVAPRAALSFDTAGNPPDDPTPEDA
jgi:hypothetical protein